MASIQTTTCSLEVAIAGLKNQTGQLCFSLFDNETGFPGGGQAAICQRVIPASAVAPCVTFDDLVPGYYAVAAFHDANGDGILNRGLMGIPREGFGFSNNPKILMAAPSFQRAAVWLNQSRLEIEIQLKYF